MTGAPITVAIDEKNAVLEQTLGNASTDSDAASGTLEDGADGDVPNEIQRKTLRRMGDSMPAATWLVAVIELCERFTYYGCQGLFQNYIQKPYKGTLGQGALGLGHRGATGLNTFFQFWCYGEFCQCA